MYLNTRKWPYTRIHELHPEGDNSAQFLTWMVNRTLGFHLFNPPETKLRISKLSWELSRRLYSVYIWRQLLLQHQHIFTAAKRPGRGEGMVARKKFERKKGTFSRPLPHPLITPATQAIFFTILSESLFWSIQVFQLPSLLFFFFFLISSLHDRTQKQTIRVCFISALLQSQLFLQSVDEVVISKTLSMLQCFKKPDL